MAAASRLFRVCVRAYAPATPNGKKILPHKHIPAAIVIIARGYRPDCSRMNPHPRRCVRATTRGWALRYASSMAALSEKSASLLRISELYAIGRYFYKRIVSYFIFLVIKTASPMRRRTDGGRFDGRGRARKADKVSKCMYMYIDRAEGRITFPRKLIGAGNMLPSYFNHWSMLRTRARLRLWSGNCCERMHSSAGRARAARSPRTRGNTDGKMIVPPFAHASSARSIHRVSIFSAFSLRSSRIRPLVPGQMPWAVFISDSADESGSRRLSRDHTREYTSRS